MESFDGHLIVIPALNEENNIGFCIQSLVDQDRPNWRCVVGDNCSDDGTRMIVENFGDPRVTVVAWGERTGSKDNILRTSKWALDLFPKSTTTRLLAADDQIADLDYLAEIESVIDANIPLVLPNMVFSDGGSVCWSSLHSIRLLDSRLSLVRSIALGDWRLSNIIYCHFQTELFAEFLSIISKQQVDDPAWDWFAVTRFFLESKRRYSIAPNLSIYRSRRVLQGYSQLHRTGHAESIIDSRALPSANAISWPLLVLGRYVLSPSPILGISSVPALLVLLFVRLGQSFRTLVAKPSNTLREIFRK